jgi:hypothetical protein
MGKLTTKRMTEKALIVNCANARRPGAGRPKGSMSADKIALRDRCRVKDSGHVSYLEQIAANDKSGAVRVAAIRELFDRGHGRCPQPIDGDGLGGPIVIRVVTRVPGPDDD